MYEISIDIPFEVGTLVYCKRKFEWEPEWVLYKITNLMISCNKKGGWTKKYIAKKYDTKENRTIDSSYYFNFEDIGKTVITEADYDLILEKELEECW